MLDVQMRRVKKSIRCRFLTGCEKLRVIIESRLYALFMRRIGSSVWLLYREYSLINFLYALSHRIGQEVLNF
jgi:hypothetical protein